jgi:anti-sigma-K factor RskA
LHPLEDLPAYALGALDGHERARVERHLAGCPSCSQARDEFRRAALALDATGGERPPSTAWAGIAAALPGARAPLARALRVDPASPAAVRPRRSIPAAWGVAAALALLALAGWNAWLQTHPDKGDVASLAAREEGGVIPLEPPGEPGGPLSGRLYVSDDGLEGGLAVTGLHGLAGGQRYEIWFVRHDQSRAGGGLFTTDARGQALVRVDIPGSIDEYEGVAITAESAGGAMAPTSDDLLAGPLYE